MSGTYCWYASKEGAEQDRKQCIPLFSQGFGISIGWRNKDWKKPSNEDYEINGRYCLSGLAFPKSKYEGRCTEVDKVYFGGRSISSPYQCDPTDNEKFCELRYNKTDYEPGVRTSQGKLLTQCRCSLDGDTGFCGNIIGTQRYRQALTSLKTVLGSSNCHTLDREDFRALKDSCRSSRESEWELAVDEKFQINHWPYVNSPNKDL